MNDDDDLDRVTLELPVVRPDEGLAGPAAGPAAEAAELELGLPRRVTLELPAAGLSWIAERILLILRTPQEPGETVEAVFCRRERELAAMFQALAPVEADELLHRLSGPRVGDPVAMGFARLAPERRQRLLAYLG